MNSGGLSQCQTMELSASRGKPGKWSARARPEHSSERSTTRSLYHAGLRTQQVAGSSSSRISSPPCVPFPNPAVCCPGTEWKWPKPTIYLWNAAVSTTSPMRTIDPIRFGDSMTPSLLVISPNCCLRRIFTRSVHQAHVFLTVTRSTKPPVRLPR